MGNLNELDKSGFSALAMQMLIDPSKPDVAVPSVVDLEAAFLLADTNTNGTIDVFEFLNLFEAVKRGEIKGLGKKKSAFIPSSFTSSSSKTKALKAKFQETLKSLANRPLRSGDEVKIKKLSGAKSFLFGGISPGAVGRVLLLKDNGDVDCLFPTLSGKQSTFSCSPDKIEKCLNESSGTAADLSPSKDPLTPMKNRTVNGSNIISSETKRAATEVDARKAAAAQKKKDLAAESREAARKAREASLSRPRVKSPTASKITEGLGVEGAESDKTTPVREVAVKDEGLEGADIVQPLEAEAPSNGPSTKDKKNSYVVQPCPNLMSDTKKVATEEDARKAAAAQKKKDLAAESRETARKAHEASFAKAKSSKAKEAAEKLKNEQAKSLKTTTALEVAVNDEGTGIVEPSEAGAPKRRKWKPSLEIKIEASEELPPSTEARGENPTLKLQQRLEDRKNETIKAADEDVGAQIKSKKTGGNSKKGNIIADKAKIFGKSQIRNASSFTAISETKSEAYMKGSPSSPKARSNSVSRGFSRAKSNSFKGEKCSLTRGYAMSTSKPSVKAPVRFKVNKPEPKPNVFAFAAIGRSQDCINFAACFESLCAETDEGDLLREDGFMTADPNGSGLCSLVELEEFVLKSLLSRYPQTGQDLFDSFLPCYIRSFVDAKDYKADSGEAMGGTNLATDDDLMSKEEFRLFCTYLTVYAAMFDAFAKIGGSDTGRPNDDKRIVEAEWLRGYKSAAGYGLKAFEKIETEKDATAVFTKIDCHGGGVVLFDEWCWFIKQAEVKAGSPVGKLLVLEEGRGFGKKLKLESDETRLLAASRRKYSSAQADMASSLLKSKDGNNDQGTSEFRSRGPLWFVPKNMAPWRAPEPTFEPETIAKLTEQDNPEDPGTVAKKGPLWFFPERVAVWRAQDEPVEIEARVNANEEASRKGRSMKNIIRRTGAEDGKKTAESKGKTPHLSFMAQPLGTSI
jgi:hypothetical protein